MRCEHIGLPWIFLLLACLRIDAGGPSKSGSGSSSSSQQANTAMLFNAAGACQSNQSIGEFGGKPAVLMPEYLSATTVAAEGTLRPHIVLVLFDDLGYHDLGTFSGVKRDRCQTPVMNHLSESGVRLTNFYSMPICSPTRAAIMTGRYPLRYGGHVGTTPGLAADQGWAPLGEPMLAERMRDAGYATYMSGKWHLGRASRHTTPTGRGFQEFFGKYEGGGDHWTHTLDLQADSRDEGVWPGHPDYAAAPGPLDLHHDKWAGKVHTHHHIFNRNGTHSTDVIAQEAARMIQEHDPSQPMFMYVAFQAPHWPIQNPAGTEERHFHIQNKRRRKWCGLVAHIDDNMGRMVAALTANNDMWSNTLLIVLSDNGGDVRTGASNHPFRGDKMTPWEGGTKSPTFIYSPNEKLIPARLRGTSNPGLAHVTDLFPTIVGLAGGDASPTSTGPLDSVDLWQSWHTGSKNGPRTEVLYNVDPEGLALIGAAFMTTGKMSSFGGSNDNAVKMVRSITLGNTPEKYEALRVGKWKLIVGLPGRGDWYGTDPSPTWPAAHIMGPDMTDYDVLVSGGPSGDMKVGDGGQFKIKQDGADGFETVMKQLWLFDLDKDPTETTDVSQEHADVVADLKARIAKHRQNMAPPLITEPQRWTREEIRRVNNLNKQGTRFVPGHNIFVQDWWVLDDDHLLPSDGASGGKSRL